MAATASSAKSSKPGRLYICSAQWFEKSTKYTRDFVICALSKDEAKQIILNHIPLEIRESVSEDNHLDTLIRDYGVPLPRRTYLTTDIRMTDKTNPDLPSAMETTVMVFASLWGQQINTANPDACTEKLIDHDFMMQTIYKWSKEYLNSSKISREQFFKNKITELGTTPIDSAIHKGSVHSTTTATIDANTPQCISDILAAARHHASIILEDAQKKASKIESDAYEYQRQIYTDTQAYSQSLYDDMFDAIQTKSESFNHTVNTISEQLLSILAAAKETLSNISSETTAADANTEIPDDAITNMLLANAAKNSEEPFETKPQYDSQESNSESEHSDDENDALKHEEYTPAEETISEQSDSNEPIDSSDQVHLMQTDNNPLTDSDNETSSEQTSINAATPKSPDEPVQTSTEPTLPEKPADNSENSFAIYTYQDIDTDDLKNFLTDEHNRLIITIHNHTYTLSNYLKQGRKQIVAKGQIDPFNSAPWLWSVLCMSRTHNNSSALTTYLKMKHIPPEQFILPDEAFWKKYEKTHA